MSGTTSYSCCFLTADVVWPTSCCSCSLAFPAAIIANPPRRSMSSRDCKPEQTLFCCFCSDLIPATGKETKTVLPQLGRPTAHATRSVAHSVVLPYNGIQSGSSRVPARRQQHQSEHCPRGTKTNLAKEGCWALWFSDVSCPFTSGSHLHLCHHGNHKRSKAPGAGRWGLWLSGDFTNMSV